MAVRQVPVAARLAIVLGALMALATLGVITPGSGPLPDVDKVAALPQPTDAFPVAISANGRYLVDSQDRPFFMNGDAPWSMIVELDQAETLTYLNDRQAKGFNTLLVELIENEFSSNPPNNAFNQAPFTGAAFSSTLNEAYFDHVDWVVDAARDRGITLLMTPAYLGYGGGTEGWYQEMVAAGTNAVRNFGAYVGNRYKNYPNIIWVMGGDYNAPDSPGPELVNALAEGINSADPNHLMTGHTQRGTTASAVWGSQGWLDIDNVYSGGPPADDTALAYANRGSRPLFFIEGRYENENGGDIVRLRTQAWGSVLAGAFGHIFGNSPIWHFSTGGVLPDFNPWVPALQSPGSKSMAAMRSLIDILPWQNLAPNNSFIVSGASSGYDRAVASTWPAGGLALVYVPSNRAITVNLDLLTPGSVDLRWYDPEAGGSQSIATAVPTTGTRTVTPPGANVGGDPDWVLVVTQNTGGSGTTLPGTTQPGTTTTTTAPPGIETAGPGRLLDTRPGYTTVDGASAGAGIRPAGSVTQVRIAGRGGIPADATAAVVNLTVTGGQAPGYATVYPCGQTVPTASNINYFPGDTIANAVVADLDANGDVCIYNHATAHLILDANGTLPASTQLSSFAPVRLLDTRPGATTVDGAAAGAGIRPAGSVTTVQIAGRGGIPAGATAAVVNLTVTGPTAPGYATVYPCGSLPTASNINYFPGDTIANAVVADLDANGDICIYTRATAHLVVDVNGSFPSSTQLDSFSPGRLLDTRPGNPTVDGVAAGAGLRPAGSITTVRIAGRGGVAADATKAILNLTVTGAQAPGYATVYPCGTVPTASNVNYFPGDTIANAVVADLDPNGDICIFTYAAAHLIVDASGAIP